MRDPEYTHCQMTFVLASDIHANIPALEAFYAYLEGHGLAGFPRIYLGDYVSLGPYPGETVARLSADTSSVFLRGNHDRYVIDEALLQANPYFSEPGAMDHVRWTHDQLTPENHAWLASLKPVHQFQADGWNVVVTHGNHDTDEMTLSADRAEEGTVYLCGHTHVPRNETLHGSRILNPGSLGKPLDGDNRASFGLVRLGPGFAEFEVIRIPYNIEQTIAALEDRKVPWRAGIIESLRTAAYSHE